MKSPTVILFIAIIKLSLGQYFYNQPKLEFKTEVDSNIKKNKAYVYSKPNNEKILQQLPPTSQADPKGHGYSYPVPKITFKTPEREYKQLNLPTHKLVTNSPPRKESINRQDLAIGNVLNSGTEEIMPLKQIETYSGYHYPKPQNPLQIAISQKKEYELKSQDYRKPLISSSIPTIPSNVQTSQGPTNFVVMETINPKLSTGYVYPKPDIPFTTSPMPSTPRPSISFSDGNIAKKSITISTSPKPYAADSTAKPKGYDYPKPLIPFNIDVPTTTTQATKFTGYKYPKPSAHFKAVSEHLPKKTSVITLNGYDYPKPSVPFDIIPTQSTVKTVTTTKQPNGYIYLKPTIPFASPSTTPKIITITETKASGYEYPRPTIPFVVNPKTPPKPTSAKKIGYVYPKPIISFQPERNNEIPAEFDIGYKYPRPSVPFEF